VVEPKSKVTRAIALILAFPALVAFQLFLLVLDAPRGIIIPVALLAWFAGPVLMVIGAVMLLPRRWPFLPSTATGRFALWLVCAGVACLAIFFVAVAADLGRDDPEEFLDNLYLAVPILIAGVCAIGAGGIGVYAIVFRHERSLLVVGAVILGLLAAVFTVGELGGHEEPEGSGTER